MLAVARYNVWRSSMFCLILAHSWRCVLTIMLKTFCLKYLGKSLKEKLVKTGFPSDCKFLQGVVAPSYNVSTWETEAEQSTQVWVQPELYSETLIQKKKESLVMFVHTFGPRAQEAEAGESQFEVSLVYRGIQERLLAKLGRNWWIAVLGEDNGWPRGEPLGRWKVCNVETSEHSSLLPALCTSQNKWIREIMFMVAKVNLSVLQCPVP